MNEVENDLSSSGLPDENVASDLQEEVSSLRQQVWTLLVLLLVVSGTLSIYLMRQVTYARRDLSQLQQAVPQSQEQNKGMDQFVYHLVDYSRTHPDFVPILNKYQIQVTPGPAPAAAAPKK